MIMLQTLVMQSPCRLKVFLINTFDQRGSAFIVQSKLLNEAMLYFQGQVNSSDSSPEDQMTQSQQNTKQVSS